MAPKNAARTPDSPLLSPAALARALKKKALAGWTVERACLHRSYRFASFAEAIGFLVIAAPEIQGLDHHPNWSNVFDRVVVDLSSHDVGGITARDLELAQVLERIARRLL